MPKYTLEEIRQQIIDDPAQIEHTKKGWQPLYTVSKKSKIAIIGQAPGIKTQLKNMPWQDLSGNRLRSWLGVNEADFYNTDLFAQIPMDFYFPGKGKSGDLPPRKEFAPKWHPLLLEHMKDLELIILIGNYSQRYYLKDVKKNLTETVHAYKDYMPKFFPLPHPSPLNVRWFVKNPWFEENVVPSLKSLVHNILNKS